MNETDYCGHFSNLRFSPVLFEVVAVVAVMVLRAEDRVQSYTWVEECRASDLHPTWAEVVVAGAVDDSNYWSMDLRLEAAVEEVEVESS